MTSLIGHSLGRYHILEQLGEGGMAIVYKAYDDRLKRNVAIKVVSPGLEDRSVFLKRFKREARALANLDHPHIIKVLDYGEAQGFPYLVMDYLPGNTLKDNIGKPIPWQEAARLLAPIADALAYAHAHHIIHRDVKPSNILLREDGSPVLSDFGIAKAFEHEETVELTGANIVGTPQYMSPEQGMGHPVDERSDIYSLGIVFYETLTGVKPFTEQTPFAVLIQQTRKPLTSPRQYVRSLPRWVEEILLACLAVEPEDRFQNMSSLADTLEKMSRWEKGALPVKSIQKPVSRKPHRWLARTLLGAVVLIGGLVGLAWFANKWPFPTETGQILNITLTAQGLQVTQTSAVTITPTRGITLTPVGSSVNKILSPENIDRITLLAQNAQVLGAITSADFSGAGPQVVAVNSDGQVLIYDFDRQQLLHTMTSSLAIAFNPVKEVLFSPDGEYIAGLVDYSGVSLWNANNGVLAADIAGHVRNMSLSPADQVIALGYTGVKNVRIYDCVHGLLESSYQIPSVASNLAFSPDGKNLWVATGLGLNVLRTLDGTEMANLSNYPQADNNPVVFSPRGDLVYLAGIFWNTADMSRAYKLVDAPGQLTAMAFSPDGSLFAAVQGREVLFWDTNTGVQLRSLTVTTDGNILKIAFDKSGVELYAVTDDGTILRWGIP